MEQANKVKMLAGTAMTAIAQQFRPGPAQGGVEPPTPPASNGEAGQVTETKTDSVEPSAQDEPAAPTIETLSAELRVHLQGEQSARIQAGKVLNELRRLVEAGDAGSGVDWWDWFEGQQFGRERKDAEKLMRIAKAPDPVAELAKERERVRVAKEKAAATRAASGVSGNSKPRKRLESKSSELVKKLKSMSGLPAERIVDLAIGRGLEILYQEERDKLHRTAVEEAGHAVAAFKIAQEQGRDPAASIKQIKINRFGEWVKLAGVLAPPYNAMESWAGGVAEAKLKGIAFEDADADPVAVKTVIGWFDDPAVWGALCELAGRLEAGKPLDGRQAWDIYSTALDAQANDDAEPDVTFVPATAPPQQAHPLN
jgi:hypothetical protein